MPLSFLQPVPLLAELEQCVLDFCRSGLSFLTAAMVDLNEQQEQSTNGDLALK
jgi:hypothetical protein